ncbi:MAG: GxxExxY protein [Pirellulales bacterium]
MHADERRLNEITEQIIQAAFKVANTLGVGFLEKVYENALAWELRKERLEVAQQQAVLVKYEGVVVGDYFADLLVEQEVIVELKVVKALDDIHSAQCLNYLKASGLRVCLLLNFATARIGIKRIVQNL